MWAGAGGSSSLMEAAPVCYKYVHTGIHIHSESQSDATHMSELSTSKQYRLAADCALEEQHTATFRDREIKSSIESAVWYVGNMVCMLYHSEASW